MFYIMCVWTYSGVGGDDCNNDDDDDDESSRRYGTVWPWWWWSALSTRIISENKEVDKYRVLEM